MEENMQKHKVNHIRNSAIANLIEISTSLDSVEKLVINKAVYVDHNTFNKASLISQQSHTIKVLEQRVETLQRELDAAISAASHAHTEKKQSEAGKKAAELRVEEMIKELENTTKVFELHMEELRAKQEEISKRDKEITLLKTVVQSLGGNDARSS